MFDKERSLRESPTSEYGREPVALLGNLSWQGRVARGVVVVLGIVICQAILYGPSLIGRKILLPLDILKTKDIYLPQTPEMRGFLPRNRVFTDEVVAIEFRRRFAAREVRAGRLPLWNPYNYCGAPFLAANNTAVFSPFRLPDYLFPGPVTIAWVQMLKSLVVGVGAYLFFRRALGVGFWPAAVGAWCSPLIGFLVLWRGYPPSFVVVWLPWLLLATDGAVRRPGGWSAPGLAMVTAFVLLSGHMAMAAHVLLVAGLYFVWREIDFFGWRLFRPAALGSMVAVIGGWSLGFVLSAVQNLPTMEYLQYSYRVAERRLGVSEEIQLLQPGIGVAPQFVLPRIFGTWDRDSWWIAPGGRWREGKYHSAGNPLEGAPSGYAGLLMTLVFAPLGWQSRRHRGAWLFWLFLGLFAASFLLRIPWLSAVFRFPPFNVLKNNRFIFATAWATLTMAVIGLDALRRGELRFRAWCWLPLLLVLILGRYCALRIGSLPTAVLSGLPDRAGDPEVVHRWFHQMYVASAATCAVAVVLWALVALRRLENSAAYFVLPLLLVGEIVWQQYHRNPQCDVELYYPPIKTLVELQHAPPGRVCGWRCLPACLNQSHWLSDVRGYDGADPVQIVRVLLLADPQGKSPHTPYALTQQLIPFASPVLDMLNLRYRIHRGSPAPGDRPRYQSRDYWVEESKTFLPRAYVPRHAIVVPKPIEQLRALRSPNFDPRDVAYIDRSLAAGGQTPIEGTAKIVKDLPCEVTIAVDMKTPGVVVLSDMWFPGWNAYVNESRSPVMRANHAIRAVEVPRGKSTLVFRYQPESFAVGARLTALGGAALAVWLVGVVWLRWR